MKVLFKFRPLSLLIILIDVILLALSSKYKWYTELIFTDGINRILREGLGKISGLISISIGEVIIVLLLGGIIYFIVRLILNISRGNKIGAYILKAFCCIVNIILYGGLAYLLVFGLNFHTPSLNHRLIKEYNHRFSTNIRTSVDNEKRVKMYKLLEKKAKEAKTEGLLDDEAASRELTKTFDIVAEEFPILKGSYPIAKKSMMSPILKEFGLDGRYFMLTNEAVLSKELPKRYMPFAMAKYMAYQRGIVREDEALFYAYKVCINSDAPEIKYTGYLSAMYMLLESLSIYDKIDYNYFVLNMDPQIKKDLEEIHMYKKSYGAGTLGMRNFVNKFYKINGDLRITDIDTQFISILFNYYSLVEMKTQNNL